MEQLSNYCIKKCYIDGIYTCVVSPKQHDRLLGDEKLLEELKIPKTYVETLLKEIREINNRNLYLAFAYHPNWKRCNWSPLHCYKNEDSFYHVFFRSSWMCRECGTIYYAKIIMPMVEADATFYHGTKNQYPAIPAIFKTVQCPKCGVPLQNHFIILDEMAGP